ncbi:ClpX C4-type zinc finger protein [Amycolatopsis azurea]|uniref:ClpX C4-type zinc finger protein n=1 Tax=Amycolatopsis azurea TaxID=36819 RepID=UPI00382242F2
MTTPACSFCGADTTQAGHLFTGPGVWICDGCVRASHEILESLADSAGGGKSVAAVNMDDPIMATIAQVQQAASRGQREQASEAYARLWNQAELPLHRVTIAHYMADLQGEPADELLWDRRALTAAAELPADDPEIAPLRASLHINAAAAFHGLGRDDEARAQLEAARKAESFLPEDGYGRLVRTRIDQVAADLGGRQTLL